MNGMNNNPAKPSRGPWRLADWTRPGTARRTVLDGEGRQIFFAFGPNAETNIELVLKATSPVLQTIPQTDTDIFTGASIVRSILACDDPEFVAFMAREMGAAVERWQTMTPEKLDAYRDFNDFAERESGSCEPDGPWAQQYRERLRKCHSTEDKGARRQIAENDALTAAHFGPPSRRTG